MKVQFAEWATLVQFLGEKAFMTLPENKKTDRFDD